MNFHIKLPRNKKELVLFLSIISVLSVNIIAPLITCFELGFSFNSHIIINIHCTVFLMSIFLTVIGTWIGMRSISMEPIRLFFYKWPRNAAISFFAEACIAQSIARFVML